MTGRALPVFPGGLLGALAIETPRPAVRDHLMDRYLRALDGLTGLPAAPGHDIPPNPPYTDPARG